MIGSDISPSKCLVQRERKRCISRNAQAVACATGALSPMRPKISSGYASRAACLLRTGEALRGAVAGN